MRQLSFLGFILSLTLFGSVASLSSVTTCSHSPLMGVGSKLQITTAVQTPATAVYSYLQTWQYFPARV